MISCPSESEGAGMAEKLPDPLILQVRRTGSPKETRSRSILDERINEPIAPVNSVGRPFWGSGRTSIEIESDFTSSPSSLPNPKNGSLKNGFPNGELRLCFTRTRRTEENEIDCIPGKAPVMPKFQLYEL